MEILGIDIGGSGIKGAIVNIEKGELISDRIRLKTPQPATPYAISKTLKNLIEALGWNGKIGCGFPAAIINGIVKTAANIDKSWIGINIEDFFAQETQCEVKVANDADVAGMAEMKFGAGKDSHGVVIMLTSGTGIGSALFINKILVPNTELGHIQIGKDIAEKKFASDKCIEKQGMSEKKWARHFNIYLNEIYKLFYPELIILGGGISKKWDEYYKEFDVPCNIQPAYFRNKAGIVGAAMLFS